MSVFMSDYESMCKHIPDCRRKFITPRLIVNWVYNYNIILMVLRVKVYIFLSVFVLLECVLMLLTSTTETYF